MAGGNFLSASKKSAGVIFDNGVIFFAYEALGNDFFARNIEVVALICLGGGGDDGFGEALILFHPVGKTYAAQFATSVFVARHAEPVRMERIIILHENLRTSNLR